MFISRASYLGVVGSLFAVGGFACSSSTTTDTTTTVDGGAKDGSVADGSVADGSVADGATDDAADAAPDTAVPSTKGGLVFIAQTKTGITYGTAAGAAIYLAPAVVTGATCTSTPAGACTVSECDGTAAVADAGAPPSAGNITITGGLIGDAGIVLAPGTDGTYATQTGAAQVWNGGETLSVSAAGDTTGAPKFDGKTVVAPTDIAVTPPLSYVTPTNVSRTADYAFAWTGGGAGDVVVTLATVQGSKTVSIVCRGPVSAHGITVPQAAVAKLLATSTTQLGSISAQPLNDSTFVDGDYAMKFSASATTLAGTMTTN